MENKQMTADMIKGIRMEFMADKRLLGRLKTLRKHYQEKRDRTVEQRRERIKQLLGDYPTERDAQEAYGYDIISEEEYSEILVAIKKGQQEVDAESEESIIITWLDIRFSADYCTQRRNNHGKTGETIPAAGILRGARCGTRDNHIYPDDQIHVPEQIQKSENLQPPVCG